MSYLATNGRCERGRWMVEPRSGGAEVDCGRCINADECGCEHGESTQSPPNDDPPSAAPVYPSSPRLSPDGSFNICDQCKREWKLGENPGYPECAAAWAEIDRGKIFVCHLAHSAPRAAGWYWWIAGDDDGKVGPFATEAEAHSDIHNMSRESDGR